MLQKLKKWFSKDEGEVASYLPKDENASFELIVDNLKLGILKCEGGEWIFKYTDEFKKHKDEYNRIIGFPDLNKTYYSDYLWSFFQVRIPGLKQPAVREILKNEHIDENNEVELLKRFGRKTISNPYELVNV
jgi:HipA-like protein